MSLASFTLLIALLCLSLVALTLLVRLVVPIGLRFLAMTNEVDSLQNRVFPLLAFIALVSILIKLTVF